MAIESAGIVALISALTTMVATIIVLLSIFNPKKCVSPKVQSANARLPSLLEPFERQNESLPDCPVEPPNLIGPIPVEMNLTIVSLNPKNFSHLFYGHGFPLNCKAIPGVAIIIPFRNRETHLPILLQHLHQLLQKQQIDYSIFVIEQVQNQTFNRGKLLNIGFIEALKVYNYQCFIFHDVDLLPEDDRNLYTCPEHPRHMSRNILKNGTYTEFDDEYFGGVTALRTEDFQAINGFSNDYWGWGGEDDDLLTRVKLNGFKVTSYSADIAKYKAINHTRDRGNDDNPCRFKLMDETHKRFCYDGINSCNYEIMKKPERKHLYTHFLVDLYEAQSRKELHSENKMFENC